MIRRGVAGDSPWAMAWSQGLRMMLANHPSSFPSARLLKRSRLVWAGAIVMPLAIGAVMLGVVRSKADQAPIKMMAVESAPQVVVAKAEPLPKVETPTAPASPPTSTLRRAEMATLLPEDPVIALAPPAGPSFDGRPLRQAGTLEMVVTAYSPDERSCGKSADGITASGYSVWTNGMYMVAADTRILKFGSLVSIPGYHLDKPVPVLDRGGAIKGHRLDLLFPTHEQARAWGKKTLTVTVWEYAD